MEACVFIGYGFLKTVIVVRETVLHSNAQSNSNYANTVLFLFFFKVFLFCQLIMLRLEPSFSTVQFYSTGFLSADENHVIDR